MPSFCVQIERRPQLLLVVRDVAGGFVMADQLHALLLRVGRQRPKSKSGYGSVKLNSSPSREPVAIPALVPAFDQHAAEAIGRGEVDVAARLGGGRAVLGSRAPGLACPGACPTRCRRT